MDRILLILLLLLTAFAIVPAPASWGAEGPPYKMDALMQTWGVWDESGTTGKNTFRARRVELAWSGSIVEGTRWAVMVDPAKSLSEGVTKNSNDNKILQDLKLGMQLGEHGEVVVGQMKILGSAEGLQSTSELILPERSLVGRTYGDRRQQGLQLFWKGEQFRSGLMLSNGGKGNTTDTNSSKDIYLRGDFYPHPGLTLGLYAALEDQKYSAGGGLGANVEWKGEKETVRLEYGQLNKNSAKQTKGTQGETAEVGYSWNESWQSVLRYEMFLPDVDQDGFKASGTSLGLNYFLAGHKAKLQLGYSVLKNMVGKYGCYEASPLIPVPVFSLMVLALQMKI